MFLMTSQWSQIKFKFFSSSDRICVIALPHDTAHNSNDNHRQPGKNCPRFWRTTNQPQVKASFCNKFDYFSY
jgi:hypothetical protein